MNHHRDQHDTPLTAYLSTKYVGKGTKQTYFFLSEIGPSVGSLAMQASVKKQISQG